MWIDRLTSTRTTRAVELAADFAEQRQRVLAENLANIDVPNYQTKRLDAEAFQASLRAALDRAAAGGEDRLDLRGNAQFRTDGAGRTSAAPGREPAPNVLFHDGTNARLEKLVATIQENALYYEMAMNFAKSQYGMLLNAIRGRVP